MCGIIGIASNKPVSINIINSLKKLEYRGYDSAGLATLANNTINEKEKSVLANNDLVDKKNISSKLAEDIKDKPNKKAVEKIDGVKPEKSELKKKSVRKKSSAPKIDLEKAGLKLVETKKSDKGIQDKKEIAKTKARKKAGWQKEAAALKTTGKLEMVETKKKPTVKPKKTAKKG